jgi:predicted metal-dependent hydrolase
MIDWLRRAPDDLPKVEIAGQFLPVVLRRLPQSRRLTMRLAPDGSEVRVSMPRWGRSAEALSFVRSRADWLAAQLAKVPEPRASGVTDAVPWCGEMLDIRHDPLAPRRPVVEGAALVLGGPVSSVTQRVQRWLEDAALELLAADLAHYCARAGQTVPGLALSRAQRRWGSCSTGGTIRINWRLVMAPPAVRRSVVAHEVAHLIHFDHSPAFHALLDQLYEADIKAANRYLKREGRGLYAWFG